MITSIIKMVGLKGVIGVVAITLCFIAMLVARAKINSLEEDNKRLEEAINAAVARNEQLAAEIRLYSSAVAQHENKAVQITSETSTIKSNLEKVYEENPLASDVGNIDLAGLGIIECLLPAVSAGNAAAIAPCLSSGTNTGT